MSSEILPLWGLSVGDRGKVLELNASSSIKRRMLDLGLIKGTDVEVLQKSPAGDPVAYFIRGAVIALRDEDAKNITVAKLN